METRIYPTSSKDIPATDQKDRRLPWNWKRAAALGGLASLALVGCSKGNSDPARYPQTDFNTSITQVDLVDGARLRHSPTAEDGEDNNVLLTIELSDDDTYKLPTSSVPVDTHGHGVLIEHDNNGAWFGMYASDITPILKNENDIKDVEGDSDGIVWVNHQRATVIEGAPAEISSAE